MPKQIRKIDLQGHRGCRGLLPENTIPAFLKALQLGVTTLELDTIISGDRQVVVSHEPYMSSEICLQPNGAEITATQERSFNLYRLTYDKIREFDCGSKVHSRFPEQQKIQTYKPLLSEVIEAAENFAKQHQLQPVRYNIETKCTPEGDNHFHPEPAEFVELLIEILHEKKVLNCCIIQSFDIRTLQIIHQKHPEVKLALLVEDEVAPEKHLDKLGFIPDIYSPDFNLIDNDLLELCEKENMQLIPWTVNEPEEIRKVLSLPVSGLITDFPDRAVQICYEMGLQVL